MPHPGKTDKGLDKHYSRAQLYGYANVNTPATHTLQRLSAELCAASFHTSARQSTGARPGSARHVSELHPHPCCACCVGRSALTCAQPRCAVGQGGVHSAKPVATMGARPVKLIRLTTSLSWRAGWWRQACLFELESQVQARNGGNLTCLIA